MMTHKPYYYAERAGGAEAQGDNYRDCGALTPHKQSIAGTSPSTKTPESVVERGVCAQGYRGAIGLDSLPVLD